MESDFLAGTAFKAFVAFFSPPIIAFFFFFSSCFSLLRNLVRAHNIFLSYSKSIILHRGKVPTVGFFSTHTIEKLGKLHLAQLCLTAESQVPVGLDFGFCESY